VRFVYKHYPLSIHPLAPGAHAAAAAAQRQGKFWEMYALIFENRQSLDRATYVAHAEKLGLDTAQFEKDLDSPEVKQAVDADVALAEELQIRGTPGFFINGRFLSGAQPYAAFKSVIDEELERN
jgi:protein-disulfide isomerase